MPEINDNTTIEIPIRNLVAIIAGVIVAVFAYTEVTNRISVLERQITILEVDLEKVVDLNTDFRNNWAPPEEVQESIRTNYAQEVRLQYLERKVEEIKTSK